jgi:prophage DNA circulation protein
MTTSSEWILVGLSRMAPGTRAVLSALKERGAVLRQEQPERAQLLLAAVSTFSVYRSFRLMFQMADVEAALKEGPAPERLDEAKLAELMRPVVESLQDVQRLVIHADEYGLPGPCAESWAFRTMWSHLSSADRLYDLIALGVVEQMLPDPRPREPHEETEQPWMVSEA